MVKTAKKADPKAYEEEAVPFDDAMRTILKAKPMPRVAKPKAVKKKGKRG